MDITNIKITRGNPLIMGASVIGNKVNFAITAKNTSQCKVILYDRETGKEEKFKYPFALYTNGGCVDIREFGFEDGKEYTGNEIAKIMLQHKFYEFSAERKSFKYFKEDNVIYYSGADFKKG